MIERARIIRALLALGIPYIEVMQMPINIAYALLTDERLENTHRSKPVEPVKPVKPIKQATSLSSSGVTYVATRRKHSKKA